MADLGGQVLALRYVNVELTPLYRAVVEVFYAAKQRFVLELRPADVIATLKLAVAPSREELEPALDKLVEWGNLGRHHDTAAVARIEDFYRKQFVYHLTAVGEAAHRAVLDVEGTVGRTGSLQTQMLRRVQDALVTLKNVDDRRARYDAFGDLFGAFSSLAEQATHFIGELGPSLTTSQADELVFQHYKSAVVDYLSRFLDELRAMVPVISGLISELDVEALLKDAVDVGDLPPRPDGRDPKQLWIDAQLERWRGVRRWFVDPPPTVDRLSEVARTAVLAVARTLGRLHERRARRVDRAADFRLLAKWFAECGSDDEAHGLACDAFGLHSSRHMHIALDDVEQSSASLSWWDAPAAPIPVVLRERGAVPRQGRPATARDFSDAKTWLRHRQQAERRRLEEASAAFIGRSFHVHDLKTLSSLELDVLLEFIDQALTSPRRADGSRAARTVDGALDVVLAAPANNAWVRLRTARGDIVCRDYLIEVRPAEGASRLPQRSTAQDAEGSWHRR